MSENNISNYIYQLDPAPAENSIQGLIERYFAEKEDKYIAWFLHCYENTINSDVLKFAKHYNSRNLFEDLKQAYVTGLLSALKNYDPSLGVCFTAYAQKYVRHEMTECLRKETTGFSAKNYREYAKLRKAMAIWNELDRVMSSDVIADIASKIGESEEKTKQILISGITNMNRTDLFSDESEQVEPEIADSSSEPEKLFIRHERYSKLWEAYDNLEFTERIMLAQRYGFCPDCGSTFYMDYEEGIPKKKTFERMTYTDIATLHGFSSPDTAKHICEKALQKIKEAMEQ